MGFLGAKYRAYKDARSGRSAKFSDDDIEKYTGKSRVDLDKWAVTTEGVGRWQPASSMMAGGTVGLGMHEMPMNVTRQPLKFGPEWEKRHLEWEQQHRNVGVRSGDAKE
ncbi:uncharacterized protein B0I36DRAFT_319527 [Microdochium trichocladiopsis]|uniref:Uncharacterized protein n=1 Tax=Microdochium trichocladiopsis TaxID=1682393 RepID=A0A9P8YFF4_9PEZI|nr:uncharacterized protein B0I36DRAFT_319527 [Microdochium trichocladiopsis]KAH7036012.1 hypothetical protein B0I36DRAFT_319527 [Microdochium trichocladiopsis]